MVSDLNKNPGITVRDPLSESWCAAARARGPTGLW